MEFAKSIGAFYQKTSAFNNTGINTLFMELGKKFIDPNYQMNMKRRETIKPNELKSGQNKIEFNKKKCC